MSLSITCNSALAQTQSVSNTRQTRTAVESTPANERPEPAGNLINAIANALQNLASSSSSSGSSSTTTSSESSNSDSTSADSNGAAQALGEFLQNLMSTLQQQSPHGAGKPPPPSQTGRIADDQGPLAKDLQKLITSLTTTQTSSESASADTSATETSAATSSTGSSSALTSSFEQLLSALHINKTNGNTQLSSFLQDVMTQVSGQSSQGNWINTSA